MNRLQRLLNETGADLRHSLRAPEFLLPTLILPGAFYLLFGITFGRGGQTAIYLLATYGVFAVMGPSLFGFGAGVASDREKGWLQIKRTLPAPAASFIAARLLTTLVFGCAALLPIYLAAGWLGDVALPRSQWWLLLASHLTAVIPFALIGLCIGLNFGANAAIAVANIVFLALAVLGGLWFPLTMMPQALQQAAQALPSWHLASVSLAVVGNSDGVIGHLIFILVLSAVLAAIAMRGWTRQT